MLWSQTYGGEEGECCSAAVQTEDGGFALAGYTTSFGAGDMDFWLVKIDEEGEEQWTQTYGGGSSENCTSLIQTFDGGFALAGLTTSFGEAGINFWMVRTDENGDSLWSRTFGGEENEVALEIVQTDDLGYAMAGYTTSYGAGLFDFWLVRLGSEPSGILEGFVLDAADDNPLEDAIVMTSYGAYTQTDDNGFWQIDPAIPGDFDITGSKQGYNDSTLTDLQLEIDDTLTINFHLRHPEFVISDDRFEVELAIGESCENPFTVSNNGNGLLTWSVEPRLVGDADIPPWEHRRSYYVGEAMDDVRIEGVVFVGDNFYVTGAAGDDTSKVYVFTREGELVRSFNQFSDDNRNMRDLTWDGELLWGVEQDHVYGFTTGGELINQFNAWTRFLRGITWDADREVLWICGVTTDIKGYNQEGEEELELNRHGFRIYGLAYWQSDPDSCSLYILHSPGENRQVIHKMNPESGDTLFVRELEPEIGGRPGGAFISPFHDQYSTVFINLTNVSPNEGGDRVDIWQLYAHIDWMQVEPVEGGLSPDETDELTLTIDATDLQALLYEGELQFTHNALEGEAILPVNLQVTDPRWVKRTEDILPIEFATTGIYPNPFNASMRITYNLPFRSHVALRIYNLSGRLVAELSEGNQQSGIHTATLDDTNLPSGLYFVQLEASEQVFIRKVMLIR